MRVLGDEKFVNEMEADLKDRLRLHSTEKLALMLVTQVVALMISMGCPSEDTLETSLGEAGSTLLKLYERTLEGGKVENRDDRRGAKISGSSSAGSADENDGAGESFDRRDGGDSEQCNGGNADYDGSTAGGDQHDESDRKRHDRDLHIGKKDAGLFPDELNGNTRLMIRVSNASESQMQLEVMTVGISAAGFAMFVADALQCAAEKYGLRKEKMWELMDEHRHENVADKYQRVIPN